MAKTVVPDPVELRAWRDATLFRLTFRASRAEMAETLARVQARGYRNVTLADTGLLSNLDTEGTTISALARRAGVTRQAASQQVAALERAGYITRRPDPSDGRAMVVRQTAKGRALLADALAVVAEIEAEYAAAVGPELLGTLKDALAQLVEHIDPAGTLGRE